MNSKDRKTPPRAIRESRSKSPRHIKPYSKENSSKATTDINDLRIQAIENRIARQNADGHTSEADNNEHLLGKLNRELTEQETTFKSLMDQFKKSLNQTEFNLMNEDYIYKEHCTEIRRQIQLAKETKIARIEEITTELMNKVDNFEKELLEDALNVDKSTFADKIKEMKQENEKWDKNLDEYKVDNQLIADLRDSLSKIAFQKDALNSQLLKRILQFKENTDDVMSIGEISIVSLDSTNIFNLRQYFLDLAKEYHIECSHDNYCDYQCQTDYDEYALDVNFRFKATAIMKNGDLLVCGEIEDQNSKTHDVVLLLFDLQKNVLKQVKKIYVNFLSIATSSDKICLVYQIKENDERYEDRREKGDEIFGADDAKKGAFVFIVLDENLEKLHRITGSRKDLVGANSSYLFFAGDKEHDGEISMYDWTLKYVKSTGQKSSPFCFGSKILKFVNIFERYFFLAENKIEKVHLKIFDETTGQLLKTFKIKDFLIDCNMNLILFSYETIKYLSFNGDLLQEVKMKNKINGCEWFLNERNNIFGYNLQFCVIVYWNRYNHETHEVI